MQEIYKGRIKNVDELHLRILTAWDKLDQQVIDMAVSHWCIFVHMLKQKADTLNTNRARSLEC